MQRCAVSVLVSVWLWLALQDLHLPKSRVPLSLLFDYPTLRKLTEFLRDCAHSLSPHPALFQELPSRETGAKSSKNPLFRRVGVQRITTSLADGSQRQQFLHTAVIGCDAAIETPLARWDVNEYCQDAQSSLSVTRHGSFLTEIGLFDAAHFEMSFAEAAVIDPGQRLVLECAAEVLPARSGARVSQVDQCAVVVAQFQNDWSLLMESNRGPTSHVGAGVCAMAALEVKLSLYTC